MKKLILLLTLFSLNATAVTFDDNVVENHMKNGLSALKGNGRIPHYSAHWGMIMKVTECRSGKKYFEKADKLKRANVLETIKTNKESVVFRYYASLVRPEKSKRHAHQFMVMDNAQSYQTHVAAVYRTVDGKKRLALTHPGQLKSGLSCVSFKVFEEI